MQLILEYVLGIENILTESTSTNFQVEQSTLQHFVSWLFTQYYLRILYLSDRFYNGDRDLHISWSNASSKRFVNCLSSIWKLSSKNYFGAQKLTIYKLCVVFKSFDIRNDFRNMNRLNYFKSPSRASLSWILNLLMMTG